MALRVNRNRAIASCAFIVFLIFLFHHSNSESDFRKTTEAGLSKKEHLLKQGKVYLSDAELTAQTSKALDNILEKQRAGLAADNVAEVAQTIPSTTGESLSAALKDVAKANHKEAEALHGDVSVAGRKSMQKPQMPKEVGKEQHYPTNSDVGAGEEKAYNGAKVEKVADLARENARDLLQQILKRSPIIIFSKSTCPYSKRAKSLLLDTYDIRPAPHVVELDLMTEESPRSANADQDEPVVTTGRALQNLLGEMTGRKTVPNIMVAAHSIGGSDDVARMDKDETLKEEIRKLAGVRVQITRRV